LVSSLSQSLAHVGFTKVGEGAGFIYRLPVIPGAFLYVLYFLLIFSTWVKYFYAARRLFLKRKLFLPDEHHPVFTNIYIGLRCFIGIICSRA